MEEVLSVYADAPGPAHPVVCFDELPYQLVDDARSPLPVQPGKPRREDYEYARRGTCNLFGCFEPQAGKRQIVVTERRTAVDFAQIMRMLVDEWYPQAERVRVVLDNLNTHTGAACALWAGIRRFPHLRRDAFWSGWNGTTRRSTGRG